MTCLAVKAGITIYERGTFDQIFQWLTGVAEDEVDLTGYTAEFTVRATMSATTALITATTGIIPWAADVDSGVYFDDAADGKYRIYINDEDTQDICSAHADIAGYYDLFLTSPAGEVVLKQYGACKIKAAVTQ